jgi:hypothetical protein
MHTKPITTKVLTIVLVNLIVLELASLAAVHALAVVSPNRRLDLFVDAQLADVTDATLTEYLEGGYDAELGWDNVPNRRVTQVNVLDEPWTASYDASGARRSCVHSDAAAEGPTLIATFGDSFTRGDEVNDEETWQCLIERHIGLRVANHGVGGYDVSQALLKAQRQWSEGSVAPITILGVYSDDLGRVLNRYRPYQDGASAGKLGFKPSFRYFDGNVVFLPNPLQGPSTVREVRELAISLADTDYWAEGWARVLPEFPYSLQMLRTGVYTIRSRIGTPLYSTNIWNTDEGRRVMLHLLKQFVAGAQDHHTHAVLLLIPDVNAWREQRAAPAYADFVRRDLAPAGLDLTVIDIAGAPFDEHRFSVKPFEGHASAYGNAIIADTVLEHLSPVLEAARSQGGHGR